ncbi:hypothetical protein LRO89_01030 [Priestia megaterium]|uniref:hypothetical protein n=1 Tax=Priestia megaterium TaxID=1404 RepID=UPI0039C30E4A
MTSNNLFDYGARSIGAKNSDNIKGLSKKNHSVYIIDYDYLLVPLTGSQAGYYDWYAAIQAAFDFAKANKARKIVFPDEPNMYVSNVPTYYSAGAKPIFEGQGTGVTVLKGLNGKTLMKISGGSGFMSGLMVRDIGFDPGAGAEALEISGTCNGGLENLRFYSGKTGIVFHNEKAGEFTEYIVGDKVVFDSACQQAVRYKKTNGNESFHGSGIKQFKINQSDTETLPKIQIDEGCFPYNSPLSGVFWARCATPLIKNANSVRHATFEGNLKIECFGGAYNGAVADPTATKNVYFAGHILALGNQFQLGKRFILVHRVQVNSDNSITALRKPYSVEGALTTGANTVDLSTDSNVTHQLNILIYGNNYEYSYFARIYRNRTDNNGTLKVLDEQRIFNNAGYGPPTLSYLNGSLVIENANFPATGLQCVITVEPIGGRSPFRLT